MTTFWLECLDCGHKNTYLPLENACTSCGSQWREARYDLQRVARLWPGVLKDRPFDLWRYHELLPLKNPSRIPSIGEGGTPLYQPLQLRMMLGLDYLFIKDERQGPTRSFKDRQASVSVNSLREFELDQAVVCSTGNVAIAYSSFCARAGIRLWAFLTSLVPGEKMREVAVYGTEVIKVTGTYDQAKLLAAQFAEERHYYLDRGVRSIPALESMKTVAFEIAEQLGSRQAGGSDSGKPARWRSPDWYIQAVSGGIGPLGVLKGFIELKEAGLVDRIPAVAAIQAEGCAPMVAAWKQDLDHAVPVAEPATHIITLTTGDPGRAYSLLRERMLQNSGGAMESVSDEEAVRALHMVAKMEGLSIEPAAAVAFAGLFKLIREGVIRHDQTVVLNCSGHTLPVESKLLPSGWLQDIELGSFELPERPRDGLIAALRSLDRDHPSKVLVIDDQKEARRLIRRVMEAQGNFEVFEAGSALEALDALNQELPDLIILDLMMPEMDGFELLENLKRIEKTQEIPIIVVTAKELSAEEWSRIGDQVEILLTKGDFLSDDLLDEIAKILT
ncbi:MAG: pyridoxal-phosphate dependent enzyme [Anaerolineales bacterium]|nr:pyridoxal-phosphate dependent enzyme [Anaerolineales bacterium]